MYYFAVQEDFAAESFSDACLEILVSFFEPDWKDLLAEYVVLATFVADLLATIAEPAATFILGGKFCKTELAKGPAVASRSSAAFDTDFEAVFFTTLRQHKRYKKPSE